MKDSSFKDFVLDQLREFPGLEAQAMFGGFGLYSGGKFFGILFRGRLYFRTSETTRAAYLDRGMESFRPNAKQRLNSHYEVPGEVIEDAAELVAWAGDALDVAEKLTP